MGVYAAIPRAGYLYGVAEMSEIENKANEILCCIDRETENLSKIEREMLLLFIVARIECSLKLEMGDVAKAEAILSGLIRKG